MGNGMGDAAASPLVAQCPHSEPRCRLMFLSRWTDPDGSEVLAQTTACLLFFASIVDLQAHRHKYTLEVIALAMTLAMDVGMCIKHACACQRASELSPQIQTMIRVSGHASWPSGHATESFMAAAVLQALL